MNRNVIVAGIVALVGFIAWKAFGAVKTGASAGVSDVMAPGKMLHPSDAPMEYYPQADDVNGLGMPGLNDVNTATVSNASRHPADAPTPYQAGLLGVVRPDFTTLDMIR